jgi:hypothetical protein
MSADEHNREKMLHSSVEFVDRYFIPVAFGLLSFLVVIQLASRVPMVRSKMDAMSGRFVSVPTESVPASVKSSRALVTLYMSPATPRPDVLAYVNGQVVGNFANSSLLVPVRDGDQLSIQSLQGGDLVVQVDHNDPKLLLPAPGTVLNVTSTHQMYNLPIVKFIP